MNECKQSFSRSFSADHVVHLIMSDVLVGLLSAQKHDQLIAQPDIPELQHFCPDCFFPMGEILDLIL